MSYYHTFQFYFTLHSDKPQEELTDKDLVDALWEAVLSLKDDSIVGGDFDHVNTVEEDC